MINRNMCDKPEETIQSHQQNKKEKCSKVYKTEEQNKSYFFLNAKLFKIDDETYDSCFEENLINKFAQVKAGSISEIYIGFPVPKPVYSSTLMLLKALNNTGHTPLAFIMSDKLTQEEQKEWKSGLSEYWSDFFKYELKVIFNIQPTPLKRLAAEAYAKYLHTTLLRDPHIQAGFKAGFKKAAKEEPHGRFKNIF